MDDVQMLLPSPVRHHIGWNPAKMRSVLRSPIKSHGGKFYLSEAILTVCAPTLADSDVWLEPCAGGANTSLQATPRPGVVQIVADVDPLTANVWRVFTSEPLALELLNALQSVDVSGQEAMNREFLAATQSLGWAQACPVPFEGWTDQFRIGAALGTIVNSRMSRGGMGEHFAWQKRARGGQPGEINSWKTFVFNHATRVVSRCRNWLATCADAITYSDPATAPEGGLDNPRHFYYYDPPYLKATRTAPNVYRCDEFPHPRLMEIVGTARAKVAISAYANPLYDETLTAQRGWQRHDFHVVNHAGQNKTKQDRIESLYTNF
jgi:site-specific DNA-adenine methylase